MKTVLFFMKIDHHSLCLYVCMYVYVDSLPLVWSSSVNVAPGRLLQHLLFPLTLSWRPRRTCHILATCPSYFLLLTLLIHFYFLIPSLSLSLHLLLFDTCKKWWLFTFFLSCFCVSFSPLVQFFCLCLPFYFFIFITSLVALSSEFCLNSFFFYPCNNTPHEEILQFCHENIVRA